MTSLPGFSEAAVRRLALARLVSWAGTQAAYIALIALIFERSGGSGIWISAALLAALGARVISSPWAGTLGDYFDRRIVMVSSDLAAAACFVAISAIHSPALLVVFAALAGIAEAPFSPASGALLAMLVPEERRGWANGAISMGTSGGMLIGAACGGVLVASFGAATAFLLNASSFVISALLALSIRGRFALASRGEREHRGPMRGIQLLLTNRVLRLATFSVSLLALAFGMTNVAELPLFVHIGAGNVGFGIGVAAWGGGQLVGGRLASRIVDARRERMTLIIAGAIGAGALGLVGGIPLFAVVALLFVIGGIGNALLNISVVLMLQRWSPPHLQGRTIAAFEAVANTSIGISLLVGGLLLTALGPRGIYLLAGGLGAVAVIVALRIPRQPSPIQPDLQAVEPADSADEEWLSRFGRAPKPLMA